MDGHRVTKPKDTRRRHTDAFKQALVERSLLHGAAGTGRRRMIGLPANPFCGHVFVFRGRRGDILKVLWFDGQGLMLLAKRLERGRFVWPQADAGAVVLMPAQLSMLLEGIDWRMPVRTHVPDLAA